MLPDVSGAARGNQVSMTGAKEPRRLSLEVRFDPEPIEGRLYDPAGERGLDRRFSGWLGLMAAIDAARGGDSRGETNGDGGSP